MINYSENGKKKLLKAAAFAKINLFLDVTGRRQDGYHTVELILQSVDLCDRLSFAVRDRAGDVLTVGDAHGNGRLSGVPGDENNLVLRAVHVLRDRYGERFPTGAGLDIRLDKQIPSQAGLGGGSADAAATLLAVNELFALALSEGELAEAALSLGADVPFCLCCGTMRATGIGEVLTPLPDMPDCGIVLVKPRGGASTGAIYEAMDRVPVSHPDRAALERALAGEGGRDPFPALSEVILDGRCNAMQSVTAGFVPAVQKIVDFLFCEGACAAQMSGSGSAVFGLFRDSEEARPIMERLQEEAEHLDIQDVFLTKPISAGEAARRRWLAG